MKPTNNNLPFIFVHGFGMRGFFWDLWIEKYQSQGIPAYAPDLRFDSPFQGALLLQDLVSQISESHQKPVILVGHSLGGILCALAARKISQNYLGGVVIIGSPFGSPGRSSLDTLIRSLIRLHLLPGALIRGKFFGPTTPKNAQQGLFDRAVPESQGLLNIVTESSWLKDDLFPEPLKVPVLGLASPWDKIVPPVSSRHLIDVVGGTFIELDRGIKMGHNDLAIMPDVVTQVSVIIEQWLGSLTPTSS